jgi:uncharacterized protein
MGSMRRPVLLIAALLLTACAGGEPAATSGPNPTPATSRKPPSFLSIRTESGQAATLHVDIADDDAERGRGLMGVEELPADQGMAFVWEEPHTGSFWMKDTLIPLSIAFWDTDGRVIAILDMEPCTTETCPQYGPDAPFIGAVEANLGWFEDHGVAVGDHVELEERAYA